MRFHMDFHAFPIHSSIIPFKAMSLVVKAVVGQKLSLLDLHRKELRNLFLACKVCCLASCRACHAYQPRYQACTFSYLPTSNFLKKFRGTWKPSCFGRKKRLRIIYGTFMRGVPAAVCPGPSPEDARARCFSVIACSLTVVRCLTK